MHKQKGINRYNLQAIFISVDIFVKPSTQCKIGTIMHGLLKIKTPSLLKKLKTNNLDLTCITETWINDTQEDIPWLHQSDIIQSGYAISKHSRPSRGVG